MRKSMESEWVTLYFDDILWLGCQAWNQGSETEATQPLGIRWRSHTTTEVLQTALVWSFCFTKEIAVALREILQQIDFLQTSGP